jgi:hypothetical protein
VFLFFFFLISWFQFGTKLAFVFVLGKKSCGLGCFIPVTIWTNSNQAYFCCFFFLFWDHVYINGKKSSLSLTILNRKVKHFVNLLFIYKPIKFRPLCNTTITKGTMNQPTWQVWWIMFKVSRFCQPNVFGHPILFSFVSNWPNPSWTHWHFVVRNGPYLVHIFINTFHPYSMILKHFLKNSMLFFLIHTKNACLLSRCDFFVKDHIWLQYMH